MYWNAQGGVRVTGSIGDDSLGESIASGDNVSPPLFIIVQAALYREMGWVDPDALLDALELAKDLRGRPVLEGYCYLDEKLGASAVQLAELQQE